jgi:TolB-like protein
VQAGDPSLALEQRAAGHVLVEETISEKVGNPGSTLEPTRAPFAFGLSRVLIIVIASVILATLAVIAWRAWRSAPDQARTELKIRTIAVLPFKPLDAESADEHLGLGITDAVIARFSNLQQIVVRPTSAIIKYADKTDDISLIGRELGVDAVLEGTVQRVGDSIRVTVQLVSVADRRTLLAEKFDEKFTHVFAVQDAVSERLAQALKLGLTVEEKTLLARRYTENPEAYQFMLKGCSSGTSGRERDSAAASNISSRLLIKTRITRLPGQGWPTLMPSSATPRSLYCRRRKLTRELYLRRPGRLRSTIIWPKRIPQWH